jgi:hypothetical protein
MVGDFLLRTVKVNVELPYIISEKHLAMIWNIKHIYGN